MGSLFAGKPLDHDSFDGWKSAKLSRLSNDGRWAVWQTTPQEGDGFLTLRDTRNGREIIIERGYKPTFTADSKWAVAMIKPLFQATRKAKIDKKKDFDMPQDSLAIINLTTGNVEKIARAISYKIGDKSGDWVAWLSSDTTLIKPKALKDKEAGRPLMIRNLNTKNVKTINWVKDYVMSEDGSKLALTLKKHDSDSTASDGIGVVLLPDTSFVLIDRDRPFYGTPVFDKAGKQMAFTLSDDSIKSGTKHARLFLVNMEKPHATPMEMLSDVYTATAPNLAMPHADDPELQDELMKKRSEAIRNASGKHLFINQYSKPLFSENGRRLIIGVAPEIAPDDTTIVDFERADLDIWRWDAPITPPQEKANLEKLRKTTYPVAIDIASGKHVLTTDSPWTEVLPADRWDSRWVVIRDPKDKMTMRQWDYTAPTELTLVDIETGKIIPVATVYKEDGDPSPAGKYVIWYKDRDYHVYDIATGKTANITKDLPYPVWDETQDNPMPLMAYGMAGWSENDEAVLIYDKHDIWSLDPKGEREPICLTAGDGRANNRRYRYLALDPEERSIKPGQKMILSVHDYSDKNDGIATLRYGKSAKPSIKTLVPYKFNQITKAKDAETYAFVKANFSTSPDVYIATSDDFAKAKKVSDINPQMKDYAWGTAELVKWYAYNGELTEGVLYRPGDFDPNKKYPMLVVFYELNSEELNRHYTMEPSWSWVNYPFYASRGYVVFVPDVKYAAGVPGESAYNYICSGVEDLVKRYPWIDSSKIGIDGQSWGGYQTAYLVTRTNMFACAGSGAPVANMTSAFGGIRWGSGDSRQPQYEQGQSRIGRNLWEAPELYIANSPVFHADRVNTPLLIMHNDDDGAVPWYQGIELFMALRRLEKPVWMLQYNGEAHNIKARKNRKDITIRLQQFFDHYLKGDPMPRWMKEGIPMVRKGQDMATDFK